jgi:hypothetical protein
MLKNHSKTPLQCFTPESRLKGVNNEIPSIILFMDQAIEKYEEELARLRKARAELATRPDRKSRATESIGELLMSALREQSPLTVKQIHEWVSAKGKIAQYHTVSSMVNYYFRKEYIKRIAPGTYAIADELRNDGTPTPSMKNGAQVPKELR